MPRNLDKRVEILFPVEAENLKERIKHILDIQLNDNVKTRIKLPDGSYQHISPYGSKPLNSQEYFCKEAVSNTKKFKKRKMLRVFLNQWKIRICLCKQISYYYLRNRHTSFALVALTGSNSVLRTKTAHMCGGSCFTGSNILNKASSMQAWRDFV